jgi:RNA polymerase sigma-70 factor (sigma-E family)
VVATGADFEEFVAGTSGRLLLVARLLTGDWYRGEDLVQEAYARMFLRWQRGHVDDPFAYVRRIVINANSDWWRRRPWRESASPQVTDRPDPADHPTAVDTHVALVAALRELTARERTVIVLRYYEGLSEATIADTLGLARGTVKSTAHRALTKLRGSVHLTDLAPLITLSDANLRPPLWAPAGTATFDATPEARPS